MGIMHVGMGQLPHMSMHMSMQVGMGHLHTPTTQLTHPQPRREEDPSKSVKIQ